MTKKMFVNLVLVLALLLPLGLSVVNAAPLKQEELTYTVKLGDNLWTLADKYLGNGPAYCAIVGATNTAYDEDPSFAHIENPDLIHPGWKLAIPSAEEAAKFMAEVEIDLTSASDRIREWEPYRVQLAKYNIPDQPTIGTMGTTHLVEDPNLVDPKYYREESRLLGILLWTKYVIALPSYFFETNKQGNRVLRSNLKAKEMNSIYHEFMHADFDQIRLFLKQNLKQKNRLWKFVNSSADKIFKEVKGGKIKIYQGVYAVTPASEQKKLRERFTKDHALHWAEEAAAHLAGSMVEFMVLNHGNSEFFKISCGWKKFKLKGVQELFKFHRFKHARTSAPYFEIDKIYNFEEVEVSYNGINQITKTMSWCFPPFFIGTSGDYINIIKP